MSEKLLVVLSCSQAKVLAPKRPIPAVQRYDGVLFKVIRKANRIGTRTQSVKVVIISAKYGLLEEDSPIPFYEQKLTSSRGRQIREELRKDLRKVIASSRVDRIYVNLGRAYAKLIEDMPELKAAVWALGGLGQRAASLKYWLTEPKEQSK